MLNKKSIGSHLVQLLEELALAESDCLFFFEERKKWSRVISTEIQGRLDIIRPTAFYAFNNQPYLLFFDLTSDNQKKEVDIHKQAWSFDQSPVIFLIKDGEIEIYNAFAYEKRENRLQKIDIGKDTRNKVFSFWNLQSGTTWNWLKENYYKDKIKKKRVNQKLFENIRDVRERLTSTTNSNALTDDEANTLILRLIFIRYLIDRDVKLDRAYVDGTTRDQKRKSFVALLNKPKELNNFFIVLNEKFNGVLFKDVKFQLSKTQAAELARVFSGELPEPDSLFYGTDFFFEIFDFSVIPVELISGTYESLIAPETRKLHSAVYTPPFLVECMLAQTIDSFFSNDRNKKKVECKVFDPSVGSGIFLVQSYRRMVDREIAQKKKITKVRLREIAENNLFGIDINGQALKVTCFSIYIAMLDYQDPKTIVDNFHFPKLIDTNLFEANFFDTSHPFNKKITSKKIDFILGNPPWKSDKDQFHLKWLSDNKQVIGHFEIAQSFLARSRDFMHPGNMAALVVTSTIFYNVSSTTKDFKKYFLTNFCIDTFFDLSPVRTLVFEEKKNPCAVVFYRLSSNDEYKTNVIKHQSIKSNIFLKYFKTLIIEKFDQKRIQQELFLRNDWMFKAALYGGALDFRLLTQITLKEKTVNSIVVENQFHKGDGIYQGTPKGYYDFLIGKPVIETDAITPFFTEVSDDTYKLKKSDVYLESGRNKSLFEGEMLLIKHRAKNESEILMSFTDKPVVFKHGVYGIAAKKNVDDLKVIYGLFASRLFTYYQFLTSASWGVGTRPEIKLEELLSFPISDFDQSSKAKIIKASEKIIRHFRNWQSEFQLNSGLEHLPLLADLNSTIEHHYDLSAYQKDVIDYALNVSRYQFQESKQGIIFRKVHRDEKVIRDYVDVFIKELGNVYQDEYLRVDVYPLNHFIALNFSLLSEKPDKLIYFSESTGDEKVIFQLLSSRLSITQVSKDLYIQKDIKGFEENSFFIIKPNEYKCWHRAMAWYDLAEVKEAIEIAEIEYLTNG
jgi:hypothetical protein